MRDEPSLFLCGSLPLLRMAGRLLPVMLLAVVGSAAIARIAAAETDSELEERIQEVLTQRHPTDGASFWQGLGPEGPRVVRSMIAKAPSTYHRSRLIEALGYFSDAASREEIRRWGLSQEPPALRIAGIRAAGRVGFEPEFFEKVLQDPDPQIRLSGARVLKSLPGSSSKRVLSEFLAREKVTWVVAGARGGEALKSLVSQAGRLEPSADRGCRGEWEGVWVHPKAGKRGVHAFPVRLKFEGEGVGLRNASMEVLLSVPSRFFGKRVALEVQCSVREGGSLSSPPLFRELLEVFERGISGARVAMPAQFLWSGGSEDAPDWLEARGKPEGVSRLILRRVEE
jgi:hypothetical protein